MAAVTEARSSVSALAASFTVVFVAREHKVPRAAGSHVAALPRMGSLLTVSYSRLPGWGKFSLLPFKTQRQHYRVLTMLMKSLHKTSIHSSIQQFDLSAI